MWRIILFLFTLSYFYLGNSWFEPSRLILQGKVVSNNSLLLVRWNSGEGFNRYEQRKFHLTTRPLDKKNNNKLIIGAKGNKNSASLSKDVVCTAIIIDGKQLDLASLQQGVSHTGDGLHFTSGQTLTLNVQANAHIGLKFQTNNHSGIALLSVNGKQAEHDLYIANVEAKYKQFDYWIVLPDGSFNVEMEMPRYRVLELEVKNGNPEQPILLTTAEIRGKEDNVDLMEGQAVSLGNRRFSDVLESFRTYYHPFQLCLQACFSLITLWLFSSLFQLYHKIGSIRACFSEEKRHVFWIFFCSSCVIFGIWLAAFWPGVMSVDSLKVWRAAMLPDVYLNDHPLLNVFLYKYLYQLWSNPAVVPLAQITFMSLLISWFNFWLYRQGVSLKLLMPCFLLIVFSVPVGVYNLMLWKDIPFALLVVFWACTLVKLHHERKHGVLSWTWQKSVILLLLALALGLIRHNGLVYLIVLPTMFIALRLISIKKAFLGIVALSFIGAIGITSIKFIKDPPGAGFVVQQIHRYSGDVSVKNVGKSFGRMQKDYMTVLDINQTDQKWDKFHYYLKDRYAYWFLLHSGWWKLYPYEKDRIQFPWIKQKAKKIYEKSYHKPWVWLSWNPVWLLPLLPAFVLLFLWFPHSGIFAIMMLAGALPLIYLKIFNWRYYYFLYLGLLFVLPLAAFDFSNKKRIKTE